MSAIFGFLHLDGSPAAADDLAAMDESLAHYGPDGSGLWTSGPVALGHRMLHLTEESIGAQSPMREDGRVALTADVILDNRRELLEALGLGGPEARELSDEALVLAALSKWGESSPTHLLGDFAFAAWDEAARTLFCGRDHMGIRPLSYAYLPGKLFAFATDIRGLLALPAVPRRLDEVALADFTVHNMKRKGHTFYRDIRRLPSGCSLTVSPAGLSERCYWQLKRNSKILLPSRDAYAEALRQRLEEAVSCRTRSAFRVGSHLSGGLDSSGLAVMAARELHARGARLVTASFMPIEEDGWRFRTERPYVEAVRSCEELDAFDITRGDGTAEDLAPELDRPLVLSDDGAEERTSRLMAEKGARVVLSGWGGDELTTFNGRGYYAELFLKGRWVTLYRESSKRCELRGTPARSFVNIQLLSYILSDQLHDGLRRLLGLTVEDLSGRKIANPEFLRRMEESGWKDEGYRIGPNLRRNQFELITGGHIQQRTETWALYGGHYGVVYRFPLLDKRLLEFCIAVPADQYVHGGWTRYLYRRAMQDILPEKIRWRPDKLAPLPDNQRSMVRSKPRLLEQLARIEANPTLARYLDLDKIRRQIETLPDEETLRLGSDKEYRTGRRHQLIQAFGFGRGLGLAEFLIHAGLC